MMYHNHSYDLTLDLLLLLKLNIFNDVMILERINFICPDGKDLTVIIKVKHF